jgi:large subunit ribosomal protein L34e
MGKDNRVTYRRRHSYNTATHKIKKVRTPGGRLVVHYRHKMSKGPHCSEPGCELQIQGIPHVRPFGLSSLAKRKRTISRAYGGKLCAPCSRNRILRAFLIEERNNVKKFLKEQQAAKK